MPRQSRIVLPDIPHHITQRGNYRQTVFEEAADYKQYCSWVKEYVEKYDLTILAFCLMENHIHFIVVPHTVDSLAKAFNTIHMRYSQYMNRKHGVRGHLWQGRYFSCFMDDQHLYRAIRYVERNPVRVGIAQDAWEYRWSSARVHAGIAAEELPVPIKTGRGLAVGSERFKKTVARRLQRSLECLPPGRPKKSGK